VAAVSLTPRPRPLDESVNSPLLDTTTAATYVELVCVLTYDKMLALYVNVTCHAVSTFAKVDATMFTVTVSPQNNGCAGSDINIPTPSIGGYDGAFCNLIGKILDCANKIPVDIELALIHTPDSTSALLEKEVDCIVTLQDPTPVTLSGDEH